MESKTPCVTAISPASRALNVLAAEIIEPTEAECVAMLAEEVRFSDEPKVQAAAVKLLAAGYTVRRTAIRLNIRPSTLWHWADTKEIREAIETGRLKRTAKLGQGLEEAADHAVQALTDVVSDDSVAPKDRIKAAEVVLDRTGLDIRPDGANQVAISVDIDFDERLARIVAGSKGQ
jgi:hypothetical protein